MVVVVVAAAVEAAEAVVEAVSAAVGAALSVPLAADVPERKSTLICGCHTQARSRFSSKSCIYEGTTGDDNCLA